MVDFEVVNLGKDYNLIIDDFSKARNSFLENLPDGKYILFIDDDEEAPQMLLDLCRKALPEFPFFRINRITIDDGKLWRIPDYVDRLVSNKVRFSGKVHEGISGKCGRIDIPIIHVRNGSRWYHEYGKKYRERRFHGLLIPDRISNIIALFNIVKWVLNI
jgi:hypothetical protein